MSENSNADTTADEQTVAELKDRIGELEARVEQQEAQRGASRRQFLGSLTGIASAGAAGYYLGTQRASAAPSWGSASGQMGTQSTPLQQVIAQTGTFESLSTGQLDSLGGSTDAGSGAVRLANNTRVAWRDPTDSNDGYILYDDSGNFLIQTGNEYSEGVRLNSPDSSNINTNALDGFETLMTLDDSNNDAILLASAGGTSGTLNLGSYSTRRLKSNISSWSDTTLYDISPKTYTKGDGGPEHLGFIAEELHDAGLTHLVQYASLDDAWDDDDDTTLTDEYLSQYAVEQEYQGETQTVVPDNVDLDAVVAAQQSLIRDLQDRVATLESQ